MTTSEPVPTPSNPASPADPASPAAEVPAPASAPVPSAQTAAPTALVPAELDALQLALDAENAAVWAYAMVAAYAPDDKLTASECTAAHLMRRDATSALLSDNGVEPPAPAAAYTIPQVKDPATARSLAVQIETECQLAWRYVVSVTDNGALRDNATAALTEAAVRFTRWKIVAKAGVKTTPFPGRPDTG